MKFGRPDTEFMKWRWKPDACCELPLFDATQFLELVRGKSLAFLGDSVTYTEDISHKYSSNTDYFKRYVYHDYNFTIATLWSPYLVKSRDAYPSGNDINSLMSLYLDELDEACMANSGRQFDYVIVSAGQWFFRTLTYHEHDNMTLFVTS
ncbi:unnamed protein product [Prunus armeniaca]|uniref:Trichome birefringence-like C-terminal domain-containing protein n=1 Tax=Prunus armeniaca TaxID=36596 RepID=A0A6J5Y5U7_PRUAR|nr:unnamed protein product [Prunus armeniaca]